MIQLFCGLDDREAIGLAVFRHSLERLASVPVSVTAIGSLVKESDGTNHFSLARFWVPSLMGWKGWAIWCDGSDMLLQADIADLWLLRDSSKAVQVVKHDYTPRQPRKYLGTRMEADNQPYPRKNWSSLILWNCGHYGNRSIPTDPKALHRFEWLPDELIGELPPEWNYLADEDNKVHPARAKLVHYTLGIPAFPMYARCEFATLWHQEFERMVRIA